MFNKLLAFCFAAFLLAGCNESETPVSPLNSSDLTIERDLAQQLLLPTGDARLAKISQVTELIDGKVGGKIRLTNTYPGGPFGEITIVATLRFHPKSFVGEELIKMMFDDTENFVSFLPHKEFLKEAEFNMSIRGIDLTGIDASKIDFVHFTDDGEIEHVNYKAVLVDVAEGNIKVLKAKLNHFSRYGWVN